ncbi:MAG TPA: tetratricopeptide repeat protein [Haliangiales bacterium]|nr:tetratricopeptide repeat protein [Haliangiales bacterium]
MRTSLVALALLLAGGGARAAGTFADAQRAYVERDYDAAIARYEALAAAGQAPADVYYNLGNAYFRSAQAGAPGRLGRAVAAYERALSLDPGMDDARYNLGVARELVAGRYGEDKLKGAERDPVWMRVAHWLPTATLAWGFLLLDALFFAALIVLRFLPSGFLRTGLVVANVFCGLALVVVGAIYGLSEWTAANVEMGVVVADEVVLRETPDDRGREGPKLHAGHRARLVADERGWTRIRLANDMEGWVRKDAFDKI